MNAETIWGKACRHLQDTLSKDVFDRWIAVIEAKSLTDGGLVLSVQNNFYQSWLEENYLPLIQDAVAAVHGELFRHVRPAATLVVVARLMRPSLLVEVEAEAKRG